MGPQRRDKNYQVSRLTSDSPLKSRLSSSELPHSRSKLRIVEDITESKKRQDHSTNLIHSLINPPTSPSPTLR